MSRIIWTKESVQDLQRLFTFLNEKNPEAAKRAASYIKQTVEMLNDFPEVGKPMLDETERRELISPSGRRGYVIRYRLNHEHHPVIIRVWHTLEQR